MNTPNFNPANVNPGNVPDKLLLPELKCEEVEELLADYVDQVLGDRVTSAIKIHLLQCSNCKTLSEDAVAAVSFMESAATVDPSPELINRILFTVSTDPHSIVVKHSFLGRVLGKWFHPRLGLAFQPRFAMSMAMLVLSMGMASRLEGVRQLHPSSLDPVKLWTATEDHAARMWDRAVKFYSNQEMVVKMESRYQQWMSEQENAPAQ